MYIILSFLFEAEKELLFKLLRQEFSIPIVADLTILLKAFLFITFYFRNILWEQ